MASIGGIALLLGDALARKLFLAIANKRRLQARELVALGHPASSDETYACLARLRLQHEHVIAVDTEHPIADFRIYYITTDELGTARELRRIEAGASADIRR